MLPTSAALHAVTERLQHRGEDLGRTRALVRSHLALIESARGPLQIRQRGTVAESPLADARRELGALSSEPLASVRA
jgi:hypothetical protein